MCLNEEFTDRLQGRNDTISLMNFYASKGIPFLFVIDYSANQGIVLPENELNNEMIQYKISGNSEEKSSVFPDDFFLTTNPVTLDEYAGKFNQVLQEIFLGNTFLINLTQPTILNTSLCLKDFFDFGNAPYMLWIKDNFVVFSPETFVKIQDGQIKTFPMKGTIDAGLPDAEHIILNDDKEMAEHATIVDLLRNDLSMIAENVRVTRYRYVEKVKTMKGDLLQVSSEISGKLPSDYINHLGDIIFKLLPAGSVTGAPKPKTVEIINRIEGYERGFYTGIFGYFDGKNLDSAVMIRFVEQTDNGLVFKSGGGITFQSDMEKEYKELIQKVYVPFF